MSVTHPYLKQLKVYVRQFCEAKSPVRDDDPALVPFCRTLEDILQDGLKGFGSRLSSQVRKTYWEWAVILPRAFPTPSIGSPLTMAIEAARDSPKALHATGKGRLLLRSLLAHGLLCRALRLLRSRKDLLYDYYEPSGIVGNEILGELLVSLLRPLGDVAKFALNLRNCSFLDESWELGWFRRFELVPCRRLGLDLHCVAGRIIVCEVEAGSVADEDLKIEPGDIIDDIFGESLRVGSIRKILGLMEEYQGAPIYISVVKCLDKSGDFYRPVLRYIEALTLNKPALRANRLKRICELEQQGGHWDTADVSTSSVPGSGLAKPREGPAPSKLSPGRVESGSLEEVAGKDGLERVWLWGSVGVGRVGTVEQIESGVVNVVRQGEAQRRPVLLHLGETDLSVLCANTRTILIKHGYPEISSCGRRIDYPLNFSYIAGETTCTLAKKFTCFVFEARCDEQSKAILKAIADGFDRTHWAV